MAESLGKISRPAPVRGSHRPLYERVQDWVFKMDLGGGGLFRIGMFCVLVGVVVMIYTATQFQGLRDPEAMDAGQLGRNLALGRGYVSKFIRPMELGRLAALQRPSLQPPRTAVPELWMPPGYPLMLSVFFRLVSPRMEVGGGGRTLLGDKELMVIGWLFWLAGMVVMYLLAFELFDKRVAVLSAFLYLFCDPLLDSVISGLSFNYLALLLLLAVYGLVKAEKWQAAGRSARWVLGAIGFTAAIVALGTLTRYTFAALLGPLLIYLAVSFPRHRLAAIGLTLGIFMLALAPWMARNWRVSHTVFGLAPYELCEGTGEGSIYEIPPLQLQRSFDPDLSKLRLWFLVRRALLNLRRQYEVGLKEVGASFLVGFFLASLLHRFRNEEVFRLRRFLFWGLLGSAIWLGVVGPSTRNYLNVFMPLIIIYAVAFFYVLFERLGYTTRLPRYSITVLFVVLNSLAFVYTILPPSATRPYPPYDGGIGLGLGKVFSEEEVLASDIPWAVAWYSDRGCVWAPYEEKDYLAINDGVRFISGIYLTQQTLQQLSTIDLLAGKQRFWLRLFQPPPPNFPLQSIQALTPDGQQVLLSSRPR